jgi:hypothetical protein
LTADGLETNRSCTAWCPPNDGEWKLQREVVLKESPEAEPGVLASVELPTVSPSGTAALAEAFPRLRR